MVRVAQKFFQKGKVSLQPFVGHVVVVVFGSIFFSYCMHTIPKYARDIDPMGTLDI